MEPLSLEDLRTWPGKAMVGNSSALRGLPEMPPTGVSVTIFCRLTYITLCFSKSLLQQDFNPHESADGGSNNL